MKKSILKSVATATLLAMSISFAGCGSDKSAEQPTVKAEKQSTAKAEKQPAVKTEKHIYDTAVILNLKNGFGTKVVGKASELRIPSSMLTHEALEDWYFNYAKKNVGDKGEKWNWAMIIYTDKPNMGTIFNGALIKDTGLQKDEKANIWQVDMKGTMYIENNEGHLVKFE